MKRKRTERASKLQMKRARQIPLSGTAEQTVKQIALVNFPEIFIVIYFFPIDVEHRKSFAEMTEAQVHPASSASAPEGFLNPQDNPNGNENSIGSTLNFLFCLNTWFATIFGLLLNWFSSRQGESSMRRTSSVPDQRSLLDKRPDPVREVWSDMLVKIADLGNACWVVSQSL